MRIACCAGALAAVGALSSCEEATSAEPPPANDAAAPAPDVAADAGPVLPLALPAPAPPPLVEENLLRLGDDASIDLNAALCVSPGAVVVAWDRFAPDFRTSRVWAIRAPDLARATAPAELALGSDALVAAPSCAGDFMYFTRARSITARATVARVRVEGPGEPEAVGAPAELASTLGWPRVTRWGARVALAFRDGQSVPRLALADDGLAFGSSAEVAAPGALANAGDLGGGSLLFSYQRPVAAEPMVSFFRITSDGVTFGPEERVTTSSPNVHDASAVPRAKGGVDLYYIYPSGPRGFTLFRRAVAPTGALGPEEVVTTPGLGEPSKPVATRAPDGTILLAYADITARAPTTGEPTRQAMTLARLATEAPPPP